MIENTFVKKMVANVMRGRKNASYDRHIMHPEREWFSLVFLGLVIFAVGVAWNIATDQKFKNVSVSYDSDTEEEQIVYREGLIETALTDFAARKNEYETLKINLAGRQSVPVPTTPAETEEATSSEEVSASTTEPSTESVPVETSVESEIEEFDSTEITFE